MIGPNIVFGLSLRRAIWRVTMDGIFFGDYRNKQQALDGIADARLGLEASGRVIKIVETV